MNTYAMQIVINVEKKVADDNESPKHIGEMANDIQAYLESMSHATDTLWNECSSIAVKGILVSDM